MPAGSKYLTAGLEDLGLTVVPSQANFVMIPFPSEQDATRVFEELLAQGVVVRPLKGVRAAALPAYFNRSG